MNWISRLFFGPAGGASVYAAATGTSGAQLESVWATSAAAQIVYSELYAGATGLVDRNVAMTVAPIKRGRAIIVGSVADLPIESGTWDKGVWVPTKRQPAWLSHTNTVFTCWHRIALTLDDLIFHGWSLWALERSEGGAITDAVRVAPNRWEFDQNTPLGIRVDSAPVTDPLSVILFAGPDEGLLKTAPDVIRGARAMEAAWVGRVQNPIPMTVLHEVERNGVTQAEAQSYVDQWSAARTSPTGAVGFLPSQLTMEVYGETVADLFTEGRNNVRLDVANHLNLPASLLDGSTATASLTYVTQEGERSSLIDWLEYWIAPIEARLSMDDVTPRGQVIRFNRSNWTSVPNDDHGPALTDGEPVEAPAAPQEVAA
jgi:hypothetical protein